MGLDYIDHGTEEAYCPECDELRDGRVKTQEPPGVTGWFCPVCGHAAQPDELSKEAPDQ